MTRENATHFGTLEALLFVSDEPVSVSRLATILETTPAEVEAALKTLSAEYAADERGFQLREVAGGWRLYTHPAYHAQVEEYVLSWDTRRLSQAALEALAVIAYHHPVTRQGVNAVRGVDAGADELFGGADDGIFVDKADAQAEIARLLRELAAAGELDLAHLEQAQPEVQP